MGGRVRAINEKPKFPTNREEQQLKAETSLGVKDQRQRQSHRGRGKSGSEEGVRKE